MKDDRCWHCGNPVNRKGAYFCSDRCRYKYNHSGPLILTLKKQWFDMIVSGVKTEEYRVMKPYWEKRFSNYFGQYYDFDTKVEADPPYPAIVWNKQKKIVIFRNGYGSNVPEFSAEVTIREDVGNPEWGAEPGEKYYVLTIHKIYNFKNMIRNN